MSNMSVSNEKNSMNINQVLQSSRSLLPNSTSAKLDLEILLQLLLSVGRSYLYAHGDAVLTEEQYQGLLNFISRRQQGEPIAYIVGHQEFWSLDFIVNQSVLIPRPETELLVETALSLLKSHAKVLELGTGSGAIAISIAHERPDCDMTAIDLSQNALHVASENAKRLLPHAIHCIQSNWFDALPNEKFDLIVSNPPYIAEGDEHLQALSYEPQAALVSGEDGLHAIRAIIAEASHHLLHGGYLLLEHGYDQADSVRNIFRDNYFQSIKTIQDYAGHDRVTFGMQYVG